MLKQPYVLMLAGLFLAGCSKGPAPGNQSATESSQVENATGAPANAVAPSSNEPPRAVGGTEWTTFTPPEGRYSVLLPGKAQLVPSGDETIKNYGVELPGGYVYLVSESVKPNAIDNPTEVLVAMRDAHVGANQLLFDKELSTAIGPGREFGFVDQDGDAWQVRHFIKDNRVYQLMTMAPQATFKRDDPNAIKFLDSLKLLDSAQSNATGDN